MSNNYEKSNTKDGIIAKKGSGDTFLLLGIFLILMGAGFLIGTIIKKEYGLIFVPVLMMIIGIILFLVFLYYCSQPRVMIKQIDEEFEIYDSESERYHRIALDKILNIEGTNYNPKVITSKGYLTFLTTEGTFKTGMLEDYQAAKQYILSLKHNSLLLQETIEADDLQSD